MSKLKINTRLLFILLLAVIAASSCTENIELELSDAGEHLVIEGNITDQPGPYTVRVYKSQAYYQGDSFPGVSATVVVSDNFGNTDTLLEGEPGYYVTGNNFQGVAGRTYTLNVNTDGKDYAAISAMPNPTEIKTLTVQTFSIFGQTRKVIYCTFDDKADETNFYRITTYHDSVEAVIDRAYSDEFTNGSEQVNILRTKHDLQPNDSIVVLLQAVDKPVYTYFLTLQTNTSAQNAAPANPISNITNGALGYFSACTVRKKSIKINP